MTIVQAKQTNDTRPWNLGGDANFNDDITLERIIGRGTDIEFLTVLAMKGSVQKMVPLDDVNPALTSAKMVCGAIGGTTPEFASNSDAEFAISVDGTLIPVTGLDMTGLDSVADTPGHMTAGAIGGTLPEFAAVSDGQFGIGFDGNTVIQVGSLDFTGIDTVEDTNGFYLCGANGTNIAGWTGVADGRFGYVIDGVAGDTGAMVFTNAVTFQGVIDIINFALNGIGTMTYDFGTDKFKLISNHTGETSSVTIGSPSGGTDVSAAGFLNQTAGSATAGTGGEALGETITSIINAALAGRGFCYFDGDAFRFVSRTAGETSAVSDLTAGTAGTDISGAAFLNGLAGTNVAGTGGENLGESIAGIINAAAAGRFMVDFDGDAFVFYSLRSGLPASVITVLTAVVAGVGTDISGPAFLNGLTGQGTVTAATGEISTAVPAGILGSDDVAFASIAAADVTNQKVMTSGKGTKYLEENQVILEGSLTMDTIIPSTGLTIRFMLYGLGFVIREASNTQQIAPVN